jgi:hypothetical protein
VAGDAMICLLGGCTAAARVSATRLSWKDCGACARRGHRPVPLAPP